MVSSSPGGDDLAFQREVSALLLEELQGDGFILTGSGALREHGLIHRPTQDIDLFTVMDAAPDFGPATDRAVVALEEAGYEVEVRRSAETFKSIQVTDGQRSLEVDFGVDYRGHPPAVMDIGSVLAVEDAVGSKVSALYSRGYPRDFLDVDAIRSSGRFSDEELIAAATAQDPGLDPRHLGEALEAGVPFGAQEVSAYGVSAEELEAVQERMKSWGQVLTGRSAEGVAEPVDQYHHMDQAWAPVVEAYQQETEARKDLAAQQQVLVEAEKTARLSQKRLDTRAKELGWDTTHDYQTVWKAQERAARAGIFTRAARFRELEEEQAKFRDKYNTDAPDKDRHSAIFQADKEYVGLRIQTKEADVQVTRVRDQVKKAQAVLDQAVDVRERAYEGYVEVRDADPATRVVVPGAVDLDSLVTLERERLLDQNRLDRGSSPASVLRKNRAFADLAKKPGKNEELSRSGQQEAARREARARIEQEQTRTTQRRL